MRVFFVKYNLRICNTKLLFRVLFFTFLISSSILSSYGQFGGSNCVLAQSAPISFNESTPFFHGNDTLFGQGNDYNSLNTALLASFSPTYFNGPDFVYYFTASTSGSITIKINYEGSLTRHLSVSLFEEAPGFSLGNHLAGSYDIISGFPHPGILTIANVNMGDSYYIVIDGSNTWINMAIKSIYSIEVFYNPVSPPCTNLGFEDGNFDFWYGTSGYIQFCENPLAIHANYYPSNYGISPVQHSIINGGTDLYGGFPCVFEGNYSAMIGDGVEIGGKGAQLVNTFEVNTMSSYFTLNYAMVVGDGLHEDTVGSFIKINMFDQLGLPISCGDYLVIAGGDDEGFTKSPLDSMVSFCQWQSVTTDLSAYVGQNVTIMVTVADCAELGHFAYAYIDCSCSSVELLTSGCNPLNISAPAGFDSYLWSPTGETTQTIENISAGIYCCEMVQNTCTLNVCKEVIIEPLTYSLTQTNSFCSGLDNGTALVEVSGIHYFSYQWSEGSSLISSDLTSHSINNLPAGMYYVSITDGLGCILTDSIEIQNIYDINSNFIINQNVSCNGLNDGEASLVVEEIYPPYEYLWPDSSQNIANSGLFAGNHFITITDNIGCTSLVEIEITEPDELIASIIENDSTSCYNVCDGFAELSVVGGTLPYSYLWDNGETETSNSNLCPGNNFVVVTDFNNCNYSLEVIINSPDSLIISIDSIHNIPCAGLCEGFISVSVSGGTVPYNYFWSNSDNLSFSDSLCSGLGNLTVTDNNLCNSILSFTIDEPDSIQLTIEQNNVLCFGEANGIIDISVIGGVSPYSYLWNDSIVSEDLINIPIGLYYVTVYDANMCSYSSEIEIVSPFPLTATLDYLDLTCFGDFSGQIFVSSINGGTAPYTYLWSNGDTTMGIAGIASGLYYLTIYDANNCTIELSQLIKEPPQLIIGLAEEYYFCNEEFVVIDPVVSGGTPEFSYEWSTGSTDTSIIVYSFEAGLFSLQLTDSNGCKTNESILIATYPELTFEAFADEDTVCPNYPVSISGIINGGTGGSYTITNNDSTIAFPFIYYPAGSDTLVFVVRDSCSNMAADTVFLNVFPVNMPNFNLSAFNGCQPLEIEFTLNEICETCTYLWHFTDGIHEFESSEPNLNHIFENSGDYSLTLHFQNEFGCNDSIYHENFINVYPVPEADFHAFPSVMDMFHSTCTFYNQSEGAIYYNWSFGDGNTANIENPLHTYSSAGSFWVELLAITDKGCIDSAGMYIVVNEIFTFYAPTAFTPDRNSFNDVFKVVGLGIDEENFNLYIYDRWGELIFYSNDILMGWDGRVKNGEKIAPIGSYVWLSIFKDFMGNSHEFSGIITILK